MAEVARRREPPSRVWTRTKILSPYIRYLVAILRFVAIYALFWKSLDKKVFWGSKTLKCTITCYILFIELNLQICTYALDEFFFGHFRFRWNAPNFCRSCLTNNYVRYQILGTPWLCPARICSLTTCWSPTIASAPLPVKWNRWSLRPDKLDKL